MPVYNPGDGPDAVSIDFGGRQTKIYTGYTVRKSVLTQPAQFVARLGHGQIGAGQGARDQDKTIAKLTKLVPPRTPFRLYINGHLQQSGFTDGYEVSGAASEIEVHGRDNMALIHDAYLQDDISFQDDTYLSMTEKVLKLCGITKNALGEPVRVFASDEANLKLTTGTGIPRYENPATVDEVEELPTGLEEATNKVVKRAITAKLAETFGGFLDRQYRRAGIFLWATGSGDYVLSEPTKDQSPIAKIARKRGQVRNAVNATSFRYHVDITHRYTSCRVFGRSPGRGHGRAQAKGVFVDDFMFNEVFQQQINEHGEDLKAIAFRDVNVATMAQAEFYARRRLAEYNRAGYHLTYTVAGHTHPNLVTGGTSTWAPNTMVSVDDDELDLHRDFYLEEVVFSRPPTQTTLTLMLPEHLVFGSDEGGAG